jgi:hypothetical protein
VALKGLVIDQPWIGMILRHEKIWEMRSRPTNVRGPIALIQKGTGTIVGTARLVDSAPELRTDEMSAHFPKHRIPDEMVRSLGFKWLTPWVLWDVNRLSKPVPYDHPKGAVTWVNLSADVEAAVLGRGTGGPSLAEHKAVTADHRRLAEQTVAQIARDGGFSIPPDASTSIRREGSKLFIDVEWEDDELPRLRSNWAQMRDLLGVLGVAACAVSYFGFVIHVWLAMFSSLTLFGAFKWLLALFAAVLVAVIGGRGDDIGEIFGKR